MAAVVFSAAEQRAMQQLCDSSGMLSIVAADQRASLRKMLAGAGRPCQDEDLFSVKRDLVRELSPPASAVLLDPEIGLPGLVESGIVPRDKGLLVSLEQTGPPVVDGRRHSMLLPQVGAEGARRLGGTAAKLLVYLRPDVDGIDSHAATLVRAAVDDCGRHHLLLVVEALCYPLEDETAEDHLRNLARMVPETASLLRDCGAKVLKLQYPGTDRACDAVSGVGLPWALLSGGADHQSFTRQLRSALVGGASGFIAGRAVWQDAVGCAPSDRVRFLQEHSRRRLDALVALLSGAGRPWGTLVSGQEVTRGGANA